MKKRTKEQWLELIQQQQASGQTQAQYCREHDVCPRYFSLRKKQLTESSGRTPFVKAKRSAPTPSNRFLTLRTGMAELVIHQALSPQEIALLVKALI
jgi:transposase-like protein